MVVRDREEVTRRTIKFKADPPVVIEYVENWSEGTSNHTRQYGRTASIMSATGVTSQNFKQVRKTFKHYTGLNPLYLKHFVGMV